VQPCVKTNHSLLNKLKVDSVDKFIYSWLCMYSFLSLVTSDPVADG